MISGLSFTETLVIPKMKFYLMFKICILCILSSEGSHFRGGTISWMPTGIPNEAKFSFKLGWRYNRGPGCTPALVGTLVTGMSSDFWKCTSGCNWTPQSLSSVNYICTGANKDEDWEQGERDFEHTFQGEGPFVVEYTSCCWIELDNMASTGDWTIRAVVDMANRSDIQKPNSSPITTGKPMYTFQDGCRVSLKIPVMDSDGDNLRCRWSNGDECNTICAALPHATLDSELCLLNFRSVNTTTGISAVAITVEDFPKRNITIGNRIYTTNDPMSSTNLQFLVRSKRLSGDCNDRPVFVGNTPSEGALFNIPTIYNVSVTFYIESNKSITNADVTGPAGIQYSTQYPDQNQSSVTIVNTTWTPTTSQVGSHILCVMAEDLLGKWSDARCVKIKVKEEGMSNLSEFPVPATEERNGDLSNRTQEINRTVISDLSNRTQEINPTVISDLPNRGQNVNQTLIFAGIGFAVIFTFVGILIVSLITMRKTLLKKRKELLRLPSVPMPLANPYETDFSSPVDTYIDPDYEMIEEQDEGYENLGEQRGGSYIDPNNADGTYLDVVRTSHDKSDGSYININSYIEVIDDAT